MSEGNAEEFGDGNLRDTNINQTNQVIDQSIEQREGDPLLKPKKLSKAEKKQLKLEKKKNYFKAKKELKKQRKKNLKLEQNNDNQNGSNEATLPAIPVENVNGEEPSIQGLVPTKKRKRQEVSFRENKFVIDLSFDDLMTDNEIISLGLQLVMSYGENRRQEKLSNLYWTSFGGKIENQIKKNSGWQQWVQGLTVTPKSYLEYFLSPEVQEQSPVEPPVETPIETSTSISTEKGADAKKYELKDFVYLTGDSENVITELDPTKIYIIGGIVDHNRLKKITLNKAQKENIATARLPLDQHVELQSRSIITVNQVMEILLSFLQTGNWKTTLETVMPPRKIKKTKL